MTPSIKSRPYILGLSIGTFWLIAASTGFAILSIALSHIINERTILIALGIAAALLLGTSFGQIRAALKLPKEPLIADRTVGRWFIGVVALEVVGLGIVNWNARGVTPIDILVAL